MYNFSFFIMDRLVSYASLLFMIELKKMKSKDNSLPYSLFSLGKMQLILNSFFSEKLFVFGDHVDSKGLRMKDNLETPSSFFSQPFGMEKAPP